MNKSLKIPKTENQLEQDQEYLIYGDTKIQFHDYRSIYNIPGLYEKVFYDELKCQSPHVIASMLHEAIDQNGHSDQDLRILDFGAGNGMVASEIQKKAPAFMVGLDILEEARQAAARDRPQVYHDYKIADLSNSKETVNLLKDYKFNAMVSVAALGFDHIPPEGFINAFNLIEPEGLIAFNLRDKFLTSSDDSGFKKTVDWLSEDFFQIYDQKTYVHRMSVNGTPIYYKAMVGKKLNDIPA
ncbi:MAG: methyltransferase domain-containing protein [Candidatus Cyclobacteriaceae bacterium M3_2C_046]